MLKVIVPGRLKAHFIRQSHFHPLKFFVKQKSSEHTIKKAEQNHRSHRWVKFWLWSTCSSPALREKTRPVPVPVGCSGVPTRRGAMPAPPTVINGMVAKQYAVPMQYQAGQMTCSIPIWDIYRYLRYSSYDFISIGDENPWESLRATLSWGFGRLILPRLTSGQAKLWTQT